MALTAGTKLRTSNLAGVVARAVRTTVSANAASSTDVAVLRLSNILLLNGQEYSIRTSCLAPNSSVSGDIVRVEVRYRTDGTDASITDTILPGSQAFSQVGSATPTITLDCEYVPPGTQTLSVLLCVARFSGTGNCTLFADGTARTIELKVISNGSSVLDTGSGNTL